MSQPSARSGLFGAFLRMPNDDPRKTMVVAILLCLFCSVLVSTAAVVLKPQQLANKEYDIKRNILAVTGLPFDRTTLDTVFAQFEVRLVDLASGTFADVDIDPVSFDAYRAAATPEYGVALTAQQDIAGIGRRSKYVPVYLLNNDEGLQQVVLPVHGYGLWSTLYGFLSLEADFNTIRGLRFYAHAETPGLGGEVDNPRWRDQWQGKKLTNAQGELSVRVARGYVDAQSSQAAYEVDGLSGATLTANGVTNLLRYWVGEDGFGPFLRQMRLAQEAL